MAEKRVVNTLVQRDRQGNVEIMEIGVKGENVEGLQWEQIEGAPKLEQEGEEKAGVLIKTDETGRLPENLLPVGEDGKLSADVIPSQQEQGIKAYHVGAAAPADTGLLWVDTTEGTGGLKYHNGTAWVHVPVAYT